MMFEERAEIVIQRYTMCLDALRPQLEHLLRQCPVQLAYLFGSQTTGHRHAESDIDIAVLLNESLTADERFTERLTLIGELARCFGTDSIDVVILNEATPLLAYQALQSGVLLYCTNEDVRVEFQVYTLRTYEDTAPLRHLLAEAMAERVKAGTFGKPVLTTYR
jgi:predicted nucleotidyltransferase